MSNPAVPSIPSFQQPWYSSLCVSLGCSDWWSLNLYCPSESALVLQEKIHGPVARSCCVLSELILLDVGLRSSLQLEKVHSIATFKVSSLPFQQ